MVFFSLGLGWAPDVEKRLRPVEYATSKTRKRDEGFGIAIVAVILITAVALRFLN